MERSDGFLILSDSSCRMRMIFSQMVVYDASRFAAARHRLCFFSFYLFEKEACGQAV